MQQTVTLERAPEEVSAPPTVPPRSSRFTGVAVLAAVAAAVLGISALGGAGTVRTSLADLTAGKVTGGAADTGQGGAEQTAPSGHAAGQQPAAPGGHGTGSQGTGSQGTGGTPAPPAAGAGSDGQPVAPVEHTVSMAGEAFTPTDLTIAAGDTVTWINDDESLHTVTVVDGPETFQSELMEPGDTFSYTFTKPGLYSYLCDVHPDMAGSVLVTGNDIAPPADGGMPPADGEQPVGNGAECVPSTAFDALMRHLEAAHLQSSPGQQVKDLADVDQYVKTHTVLVQNMLQPAFDGVVTDGLASSLDTLRRHLEVAHLQTSPGQQAADLLALDQYVKTHTVLVQNMLGPNLDYTAC